MIQKIKSYLLPLIAILTIATPLAVPVATYAASGLTGSNGSCSGIAAGVATGASNAANSTIGCEGNDVGNDSIGNIARDIVNIFSIIVGAVAVIMLIYGGFRYITSGGDSGRVGNAKNTLLYAIIGLIIVALAQIIVQFVLSKSNQVSSGNGLGN